MLINRVVTGNAFKTHRNAPQIVPLSPEYNSVREWQPEPVSRVVPNKLTCDLGRSRTRARVGSSQPRSDYFLFFLFLVLRLVIDRDGHI